MHLYKKLNATVPGVRLSVERGYPVKVDGVSKLALFETPESVNLREDAAKMVGKENRASVIRVGWLSKHIGKLYSSAVVYFKTKAEADSALQKGTLDFGGETAFTSMFELRDQNWGRYFRC